MFRQALLGMVVLLVGAAAPAYGQDVKLQLKFKEGETFWVEDTVTSKTTLSVPGIIEDKSETKVTQITSYSVTKVTPDSVVMDVKIESVNVKNDGGIAATVGGVVKKTEGAKFTVTLNHDGTIKKLDGVDDLLKKLGDDPLIKESLSAETFTKGIEQAFNFLPDKAVKKGDSWTKDMKYPLGALGEFVSKNKYTYNGKGDGGQEIGVQLSMEYKAPKQAALGGMLKVVKADLKGDKSDGTFVFDSDKGRLMSATSTRRIQGTMTVDAAGQMLQMDLSLAEIGETKVHATNPLKK